MIVLERILCPVDLSDCSRLALAHATAVAAWAESRLTVMHIFSNVPVFDIAPSLGATTMPPVALRDVDRQELLEAVRRFAAPVTGPPTGPRGSDCRPGSSARPATGRPPPARVRSHGGHP